MSFFTVDKAEVARFNKAFEAKLLELRREVGKIYRGYTITIFNYLVRETPQYTGNAAANWNYDIGSPSYRVDNRYAADFKDGEDTVYDKMHPNRQALAGVMARTNATVNSTDYSKFFPTVYMNNNVWDVAGEKYIQMLEENPGGYLREVNDPGHMKERAIRNATARFAVIDAGIAGRLVSVQVGTDTIGVL